jgi:hypothetical protein
MNKGDTIVCIDNNGNNFFTNGNKYTVIEYYPSKADHKDALKTDFISVFDDAGDFGYVFASGFTRLEDIRDEQINKILL